MTDDSNDLLIERGASAFRERRASGRILSSPSWHDLPPEGRDLLFGRQLETRLLERSLHPQGHSATILSVLSRL